ncbi:MAG: hypothetical protein KC414_11280, partial [Romboutsia sp.]|nr:hypothetical protein [Romboutsia sp.]
MEEINRIQAIITEIINIIPIINKHLMTSFSRIEGHGYQFKEQDVVSQIDHEVGQIIGEKIVSKFPELALDSEEIKERTQEKEIVMRIDPVDGSKYYISNIELFTTVVSLESRSHGVLFGLVLNPFSQKYYYAEKGHGFYVCKKKIESVPCSIKENFLFIEHPTSKLYRENPEKFHTYL